MNFLFNVSLLFSRSVFPFSNCKEIKGYLADCYLIKENSSSEHSVNNLRKFKQITNDLLFTCDTTVPELTGNKNSSQLHIRGNLACLIPVKKLFYSFGYDACCCHCGSKRKLITDINYYAVYVNVKKKKQMAKPKTTELKKKSHTNLVPSASFRYKRKVNI